MKLDSGFASRFLDYANAQVKASYHKGWYDCYKKAARKNGSSICDNIFDFSDEVEKYIMCHPNESMYSDPKNKNLFYSSISAAYGLFTWKAYKKIYYIDPDMLSILMKTDISDMKIREISKVLPLNGMCIYSPILPDIINYRIDKYQRNDVDNAYIIIYVDERRSQICMNTIKTIQNGPNSAYGFILNLDIDEEHDFTVAESIENAYKKSKDEFHREFDDDIIEYASCITSIALNTILYITSINSDVINSTVEVSTPKRNKKGKIVKKEICVDNIGVRIGSAIRKRNSSESSANCVPKHATRNICSRVPHIRCGHWHRYWVGRKSHPEERKTIIKWIPPLFINSKITDEFNQISVTPIN